MFLVVYSNVFKSSCVYGVSNYDTVRGQVEVVSKYRNVVYFSNVSYPRLLSPVPCCDGFSKDFLMGIDVGVCSECSCFEKCFLMEIDLVRQFVSKIVSSRQLPCLRSISVLTIRKSSCCGWTVCIILP